MDMSSHLRIIFCSILRWSSRCLLRGGLTSECSRSSGSSLRSSCKLLTKESLLNALFGDVFNCVVCCVDTTLCNVLEGFKCDVLDIEVIVGGRLRNVVVERPFVLGTVIKIVLLAAISKHLGWREVNIKYQVFEPSLGQKMYKPHTPNVLSLLNTILEWCRPAAAQDSVYLLIAKYFQIYNYFYLKLIHLQNFYNFVYNISFSFYLFIINFITN